MRDLDIVQFTCEIYYVEEEEGRAVLDVMRMGKMSSGCSVKYTTVDGSGKSGQRYAFTSGKLTFAPGESTKSLEIPILPGEDWNATLEFKVKLTDAVGCELGKYLFQSRVKVLDNDVFPDNAFAHNVEHGEHGIEEIPARKLQRSFTRTLLARPGMKAKCIQVLLGLQLHNLYYLLTIYLQIYLVDVVLTVSDETDGKLWFPGSRPTTALAVGLLKVVPFVLLFCWDYYQVGLDIGGELRMFLQTSLFRHYLNYSPHAREEVSSSAIGIGVLDECEEAVDKGFMQIFMLSKELGKFVIATYFLLDENATAAIPLAIFPVVFYLWFLWRFKLALEVDEEVSKQQTSIDKFVHESCAKLQLVSDYAQRPATNERFHHYCHHLNHAMLPVELCALTNEYFAEWAGTLLVAGYIMWAGPQVVDEGADLTIGEFLATIKIFKEIGEMFSHGYLNVMQVARTTAAMRAITYYLSRPTLIKGNKELNRTRRATTAKLRYEILQKVKAKGAEMPFPTDMMPLQFVNVAFKYPKATDMLFTGMTIDFKQGSIVAVTGGHREGKQTLLDLIGQVTLPSEGHIFIPTHLRVVHNPREFAFMNMSLWDNLTFGSLDETKDRVKEVLRKFRLEHCVKLLDSTEGSGAWMQQLAYTDLAGLHLARAILKNPEVLVLPRPTVHFDKKGRELIMKILVEHVKERGIGLDPATRHRRRPRTVFFSTLSQDEAQFADYVLAIRDGKVLCSRGRVE